MMMMRIKREFNGDMSAGLDDARRRMSRYQDVIREKQRCVARSMSERESERFDGNEVIVFHPIRESCVDFQLGRCSEIGYLDSRSMLETDEGC